GAEVRVLGRVGGEGLVVELARGGGGERQVELVLPAGLEARARQRVVALLRAGGPLGQVGGGGGGLGGDPAVPPAVAVGQAEVLLGGDVAQHRRAVPADHRRADGRRDVVVAGGDVGDQRPERVERRLVADLDLSVDVLLGLVHRDV